MRILLASQIYPSGTFLLKFKASGTYTKINIHDPNQDSNLERNMGGSTLHHFGQDLWLINLCKTKSGIYWNDSRINEKDNTHKLNNFKQYDTNQGQAIQ